MMLYQRPHQSRQEKPLATISQRSLTQVYPAAKPSLQSLQ